jgi:type I site-specific restriction-modification system R (restriction) subunit
VIVITDRRSLDQHLQEAVYQIEHAQGVVKAIDQDSKQLAEALVDRTKVVITTLQKFPFVLSGLLRLAGAENLDQVDEETRSKAREWQQAISHCKYALIIDEAHSSQSGDAAREMKKLLVKVIARMALMHPTNVEQKVAVMVEHFVANVRHRIGRKAKATVVTYSRLQAVRYKLAFDRYIKEKGYMDIHALVAFSGTVNDPETDIDYTEPGMNLDVVTQKPISESNLPERFASSDYQVLIAANKYQTGWRISEDLEIEHKRRGNQIPEIYAHQRRVY